MASVDIEVQPYYFLETYSIAPFCHRTYLDISFDIGDRKHILPSIPLCNCKDGHITREEAQFCPQVVRNWAIFVSNKL